jgi:PIN domain nuclease of toxin-antitoxin system
MSLLLDTHVLIWWFEDSRRIGRHAQAMLSQRTANIWVSAASVWEISIKRGLGRLKLKKTPEDAIAHLLERGVQSLPIDFHHAFAVRQLPLIHSDPFDRLLIAQAQYEGLTLVTADPQVMAYDVPTLDASR